MFHVAWHVRVYLYLVDIRAAKQVELKELPPSEEKQEFMCMHGQEFVLPSNSLVPRLFPPPVFNRLQYANMEGKAWRFGHTCGYIW